MAAATGWLTDGVVIVGYFALVMGVGLYLGRREESLHDFALGGRRIPWWAVLASLVAAETSAGTFLGAPGEGYHLRNFTYVQLTVGTVLARVLVSFIFLRPYYHFNVYSVYEYLSIRFGPRSRQAASGVFLVTRVLASGARIYVAAIALVLAYEMIRGGAPVSTGGKLAIYVAASTAVIVLTAIYTTLGGIKAVIWTDLIQASLMMGSALTAAGILFAGIPGGWAAISAHLSSPHPLRLFFDTGLNPARTGWDQFKGMFEVEYTVFAGVIASTFVTMATHGTDQDMVQRLLTAPDVRRSRLSLVLSGLADLPIALLFVGVGILLYAYYQAQPDPRLPRANNEIFAYFILHRLPAGIRGLLLAGIFATTMGSLSTALNALATSFTRDWYVPFFAPRADDRRVMRAVRAATVGFAVLLLVVSALTSWVVLVFPGLRIIPIILGIFGYTYGSLLGVFFVGMLTRRRGSDRGNLLAMLTGFATVAVLSGLPNELAVLAAGRPLYPQPAWLPVVEFPWRVMFGTVATFLVGICFRTPATVPGAADLNPSTASVVPEKA